MVGRLEGIICMYIFVLVNHKVIKLAIVLVCKDTHRCFVHSIFLSHKTVCLDTVQG